MTTSTLRILPLGGLGEIGKNMTVVEYDGRIVVLASRDPMEVCADAAPNASRPCASANSPIYLRMRPSSSMTAP